MNGLDTPRKRKLVPGAPIDDLGDGLLLRHARPEDADALAAFNADVHRHSENDPPDEPIRVWTRDLLLRPHPTFQPALFTVVEDTANRAIASSLNLIPQTWSYGGVPFGVGRIELVGTAKEYRRRGLVRRQMEEAHRWSADMGHLVQGITGIPWYYRQFGYEMCLNLGGGHRLPADQVPTLAQGEIEPFTFRPASASDVPFLVATDAHGRQRSLISCVRDDALWQHEVDGRSRSNSTDAVQVTIIERRGGQPVGFVGSPFQLWDRSFAITVAELAARNSWLAVVPSLLRWAKQQGDHQAATAQKELSSILLWLGEDHPAYTAIGRWVSSFRPSYAWFIRVPDLPTFLWQMRSVLERRLAASVAAGHTGEMKLNFYDSGIRLRFKGGLIVEVTQWPEHDRRIGADFPGLTFLQVVTGWRSFQEVAHAFPDCQATDESRVLVETLFPKRTSFVWPVS
ncbi:MAG TPA: GNAT family N-acetyltransferase [Thermomicrobiales bacterium]|nr:GNAT family N-acetyltransferase [Thermomicrobiales bacterium]